MVIEIPRGSDAFLELQRIMADPRTNKVTVEIRSNVSVAFKRNEYMWTPTLSTEIPATADYTGDDAIARHNAAEWEKRNANLCPECGKEFGRGCQVSCFN